jgi:hypothetical protein
VRVSVARRHLPPLAGPVLVAEVPSARSPGLAYRVSILADGSWACTCPGFGYQSRADGLCRHIDEVREASERTCSLAFLLAYEVS